MRGTYDKALAPGTLKNRQNQAAVYLKFMMAYGFDHLHPTITQLSMYSQFLANSYSSPATTRNYLSGARSWLLLHGGSVQPFASPELAMMSKSITDHSTHVPDPAAPLTPQDIKLICSFIDQNPGLPPAIKPAILLAYACFLRVSNVLSPSTTSWGGRHTLMAKDVISDGDSIYVLVRSTKTRRSGQPHVIPVYRNLNPTLCPVLAWRRYCDILHPCPLGPAFMADPSTPLTPAHVVPLIRKALKDVGSPKATKVSFHSLRRGAAQAAAAAGASTQDIMYHGTWRSKTGVSHYIQVKPRMVPSILASTLA